MKLVSVLSKDLICLDLNAQKKEQAFEELVNIVCEENKDLKKSDLLESIKEREGQQSTYMGRSLALPHARIDSLNDFIIVCGRSTKGVSYPETSDPVHFIILILTCKTKINILLQCMGAFATIFHEDALIKQLMNATTSDAFLDIISKSNVKIKETIVAKDIMSTDMLTLTEDQTVKQVIDLFFTHNVSGAPVVDKNNHVMGVVTEKNLISIGIPKYMEMMDNISFLQEFEPFEEMFQKEDEICVREFYTKEFMFVHEGVSVIQLAFYFVNKNCRRIIVLDDNEELRGIIMRKDLIRKVIHA